MFLESAKRAVHKKYKVNLETLTIKQAWFGPKIWNSFLYHTKSDRNLECLKNVIKIWNGSLCMCTVLSTDFKIF